MLVGDASPSSSPWIRHWLCGISTACLLGQDERSSSSVFVFAGGDDEPVPLTGLQYSSTNVYGKPRTDTQYIVN